MTHVAESNLFLKNHIIIKTHSEAKVAEAVEDVEAMVLSRSDEHRRANSRASIQQRPAELLKRKRKLSSVKI